MERHGDLKNRGIVENTVRFGKNSKDSTLGFKGHNVTCFGAENKRMVWYKIANVIIIKEILEKHTKVTP